MREHIKAAEAFEREDMTVAQARESFLAEGHDYKVELIDDLAAGADPQPLETVSLYTNGPFTDLCRGPHAPSTATVGAFKLNSVAGAYWSGIPSRTMLTRIYGTAFFSKAELEEHLERLEQARTRPSQARGELGLFTFSDVSPGAAFWLPAGTGIFNALVRLSRQMGAERGYSEVKTPQIFDAELWKTSGHWGKYRENMFTVKVEDREMGVKPITAPATRTSTQARGTPTAIYPSATSSRVCFTATSRPACCTACCGCGTSLRTTRTSSAPRSRCRTRSGDACRWPSRHTRCSTSMSGWSSPHAPSSASAPTRCGTAPSSS